MVVIPHLNNLAGLQRSIADIDPDEHVDVLVIDDGSEPAPAECDIAPYFRGRGNLWLESFPVNRGIVEALNLGVNVAQDNGYAFLARLDAGDRALKARFAIQQAFLEKHKDHVLVGSWVEFIRPSGEHLFHFRPPESDAKLRRALKQYNPFIHPGVMMSVEAIGRAGGYPVDYPALEDWALFLELKRFGKIHVLPRVLLKYEVAESSISSRRRREQAASKVRLLWNHFDGTPGAVVGLVRTFMVYCFPRHILNQLKRLVYR
nr:MULTISPECIES: glycosyltransferase [Halomonas]